MLRKCSTRKCANFYACLTDNCPLDRGRRICGEHQNGGKNHMKKRLSSRLLSLLLVVAIFAGFALPATAAESSQTQKLRFEAGESETAPTKLSQTLLDSQPETFSERDEADYAPDDTVRVSIVLKDEPAVAMYSLDGIGENNSAVTYRQTLKNRQNSLTQRINRTLDAPIDVVWNLTLAANLISANVRYDQIDEIKAVSGVADVYVENRYETMVKQEERYDPNMATSSEQIGSSTAWAAGYTGAGSKIAIIDTGIDIDHQSFSAAGYDHSMELLAKDAGMTLDAYKKSVGVLDAAGIADVFSQLNIAKSTTASAVTRNDKIPFAYNYVDKNTKITHMDDEQGEHGSHVAGIAAANKYIANADGTFSNALETAKVQGVAPDAQLVVMKVFGYGGGAYDSDYMAAIEDAIVLGCDSINLSLGSSDPGFTRATDIQKRFDALSDKGAIISISAGNSGDWAENSQNGYLYGNDVSFQTSGSPGTYSDSLAVASVDNAGTTGNYFSVGGEMVFYSETTYANDAFTTLSGELDYVFMPESVLGNAADFDGIDVSGKVVFIRRGTISFVDKITNAANAGARAVVIYNNQPGTINMDLSSYTRTAPAVSITQADGAMILSKSTAAEGGAYYTGKLTATSAVGVSKPTNDYGMSDFSSWGVPGSLELKPEITAPGGNIYSVNGTHVEKGATLGGKDAYENMSGTSMAAPQIAGMAALMAQYIRENEALSGYMSENGVTNRQLINSLLMSTASPIIEADTGLPYSVLNQGAGLANVDSAMNAESYIMMDRNLSGTAADGKVKAEFGDDPDRDGTYTAGFTIYNISGSAQRYNVYTDLFTQDIFADDDGQTYLDTCLTTLDAEFTYDFSDHTETVSGFDCDVNCDGKTDALDAQAIIGYVAGENDGSRYNLTAADLNADGKVTSYDAHLLLVKLNSAAIEIPVGSSVHVSVTMKLTDAQKQTLNAMYENGAYVEGYIYVETDNTADGGLRPVHSIPVLGFYGNWSDAPMIDGGTAIEDLYGTGAHGSYIGYDYYTDYTGIVYPGSSDIGIYTVNPYVVEDEYPAGREAISGSATIAQYGFTLIRNAAAVATYVKTADGNITVSGVNNQVSSMFYYSNNAAWTNYGYELGAAVSPVALGLNEGDKFTAGLVMIPEYYEQDGELTAEQIAELISSGELGDGAFIENTFTVDSTAPEMLDAKKNPESGELTIEMQDNQYIAYVEVHKGKGSIILGEGQPEQAEAGKKTEMTFELNDQTAGEYVTVIIGDYAGNESSYYVYYGGTPEDYSNRMFGFTSNEVRGSGKRWVEIDPAAVSYDAESGTGSGLVTAAPAEQEIYAETYAGGYVFYAADDGFYATEHGEWSTGVKVANYSKMADDEFVADMAYNDKDQMIYFITEYGKITDGVPDRETGRPVKDSSKLYSLNPATGAVAQIANVTVDAPSVPESDIVNYDGYKSLHAMTIDKDGNFYGVNFGASYSETANYVYLYKWTLNDIASGSLALKPIAENGVCDGTGESGKSVRVTGYSSMAYDKASDKIYLAAGYYGTDRQTGEYVNTGDLDNELWVLDPDTGKASLANEANALMFAHVKGIYIVADNSLTLEQTDTVSGVELNMTNVTTMEGSLLVLRASVNPWLTKNKSVTWSVDHEDVASVKDGVVTANKVGTATITATSVADPTKSATCTVTVKPFPEMNLRAAIYGSDSNVYWSGFSTKLPSQWQKLSGAVSEIDAAALNDGVILARKGSTMLSINPETFEETVGGTLTKEQLWSDAAESPVVLSADDEEGLGDMVAIAGNGTVIETLDKNGVKESFTFSQFASDPMAVIAFKESGTYDLGYYESGANFFYILTESGKLYELTLYPDMDMDTYDTVTFAEMSRSLGDTGLKLPNVSKCQSGQKDEPDYARASMIYDKASDYLVIAAYTDSTMQQSAAMLYGISVADKTLAPLGTFGTGVWPVVGLYRADAASSGNSADAQPVNKATGSVNAAKLTRTTREDTVKPQSVSGSGSTVANGVMTVTLTEDVAVTNGKYTVKYDPAALTLESKTSPAAIKAFHVDETAGEITFAFAAAEAYEAGKTLATLTFRYRSGCESDVTLSTAERNDETVTGDSKELPLHEWVASARKEPTCTQSGYIKYTCTTCTETRTEILPALGHQPIVDRDGNRVCARCGANLNFGIRHDDAASDSTKKLPFTDVKPSDACYDAVKYLYEKNIMNGIGYTRFGPNEALTRAMVVTILYRMDGKEAVSFKGVFTDVPGGKWYSDAVEWAAKHDIVNGVGSGKFDPNGEITREQLAAIIKRYAEYKGVTIYEPTSALAPTANVSAWAKDNVAWAAAEGILSATQAANAVKSATRAEVAMAMYTYLTKTAK